MTADLLTRALWLTGQVQRLHELSYDLGLGADAPENMRQMQTIMEMADKLQADIAAELRNQSPRKSA